MVAALPKVTAPADKRFRRAHVSPAGRRSLPSWRVVASVTVVLALAVGSLYWLAGLALAAEALTVTRITVSGNARMSRGEVLALLERARGESMVTADLEGLRRTLLGSPWVADAAITVWYTKRNNTFGDRSPPSMKPRTTAIQRRPPILHGSPT